MSDTLDPALEAADAIKAAYVEGYVAACEHWAGDPVATLYAERNYPTSQASSDATAFNATAAVWTRFALFDDGLGVDPDGPYVLHAEAIKTLSASPQAEIDRLREAAATIADELTGYSGEGTEDRNDGFGMFARGVRYAKRTIAARIRALHPETPNGGQNA